MSGALPRPGFAIWFSILQGGGGRAEKQLLACWTIPNFKVERD
jgi:hypothetical protein